MFKLPLPLPPLLLLLLLLLLLPSLPLQHCDGAQVESTRIIHGQLVDIHEYPFMVSLQYNGSFFGHDYDHFCCGSILSDRWIITSAQCAQAREADALLARVGSSSYYDGGVLHRVERIVLHPLFDELQLDYDFGLLKVTRRMLFDGRTRPISLPKRDEPLQDGSSFSIAGWGAVKMLGMISDQLRASKMRKITDDSCRLSYGGNVVTERMFCAFARGFGPCVGDSGSPALLNGILIGLASWSYGCAYDNPTVYARVASVVDWIEEEVLAGADAQRSRELYAEIHA